jgi:hypothetical protein
MSMAGSRSPAVALALLLAAPLPAAAAEPVFLVGTPVRSLADATDRLQAEAYCGADAARREALVQPCAPLPPGADAQKRADFERRLRSRSERAAAAAATACAGARLAPAQAAAVVALEQALTCAVRTEGVFAGAAGEVAGLARPASLESSIINGLADFVVDRARAEAVDFTLDQVSEVLCKEARARRLFPSLCALSTASDQVRISLVPGSLLRDAVVADLRALVSNLAEAAEGDAGLAHRYPLACGLRLADGVVSGLERREPPLPLAMAAVKRFEAECACAAALGWRKSCPDEAPLSPAEAERARALVDATRLALAKAGEGTAAGDPTQALAEVDQQLESVRLDLTKARQVLGRLIGPASRLRQAADAFQSASGEAAQRAATRELLAAAVDFVGTALDAGLSLRGDDAGTQEARRRVAAVAALARHLLAGEYSAGIARLLESGLVDPSREPYGSLVRMASLVVEVGGARSSAEVAKALEAAAEPRGSWRLRRKKPVWGLSARVGLAGGLEWAQGPDVPMGTVLGLHAPVGLDASWPLWGNSAAGVQLQIIDLGTLVGARVGGRAGEAGAKERPEASFAQVFSPGAGLFLGIGKSPFVVSGLCSWTPGVRPVETGSARSAWRAVVAVGVDVPIFMW